MATLVSSTVRHLRVSKTDLLRLIDLSFYKMVFIFNIHQASHAGENSIWRPWPPPLNVCSEG